jgi:hypothetical protein
LLDNRWPYVAATITIITGYVDVISHHHCHHCALVNMTATIVFPARIETLIAAANTCDNNDGGGHCNL